MRNDSGIYGKKLTGHENLWNVWKQCKPWNVFAIRDITARPGANGVNRGWLCAAAGLGGREAAAKFEGRQEGWKGGRFERMFSV